jgi:Putative DNA-binding domain
MNPMSNGAPGPLQRFQDAFASALLESPGGAGRSADVAALIRQPGFAVYRNTVIKGCIDALQSNYPAVARLVGDEWFRAAASIYARANLPTHPALVQYGKGFADFLSDFEPGAGLPYLPGVARLDRFWTEAHMARDEPSVDAVVFASLGVDDSRRVVLRPHASARWAWFDAHPVFTIWQRNRASGPIDETDIEWRGEGALVLRVHGAVKWIGLDAGGCALLDVFAAGGNLAEAGAAALAANPATQLATLFARLFEVGAFGCVKLLGAIEDSHP